VARHIALWMGIFKNKEENRNKDYLSFCLLRRPDRLIKRFYAYNIDCLITYSTKEIRLSGHPVEVVKADLVAKLCIFLTSLFVYHAHEALQHPCSDDRGHF